MAGWKKSHDLMGDSDIMLATDWDPTEDPTGFWMSEKLDGVHAIWDGTTFKTRAGNALNAPEWFTRHMPQDRLQGELYLARGKFSDVLGIVRRYRPRDLDWAKMTFQVFDMPDVKGSFEVRLYGACKTMLALGSTWDGDRSRPKFTSAYPIRIIDHVKCESRAHADAFHAAILAAGGEGSMYRRSGSLYTPGRSTSVLKRKDWYQEEARVIGYNRNPDGSLRSLQSMLLDGGLVFDVGSGLAASDRSHPPKLGSIITVKYKNKSSTALREPSFICVRDYE